MKSMNGCGPGGPLIAWLKTAGFWECSVQDDNDIMRESLDEEAQRYFEECVSIAKLEPTGVDSLMVSQEKDILSTENEEPFDWPVETDSDSMLCFDDAQEATQRADHVRNSSIQNIAETSLVGKPAGKTKDCAPLGDEGMLLPWLDWEPEVDTLNRKERVEKVSCLSGILHWTCLIVSSAL
jgi:hypothetical protein